MVAMSAIYTRVAAPAVRPHPFGLFSVVPPLSPADDHWQAGITWESWACLDPNTTTDPCINGGSAVAKEFEQCANTDQIKPITVYLGVQNSGGNPDVGEQQAQNVLADAEEFAVERYLFGQLATAVTEAAASSAVAALGKVEDALGKGYHGTGVIHMARSLAIALASQLVRVGQRVETVVGTPVAIGAGYDPTAIYGTGALQIMRGPASTSTAWNLSVNDQLSLAERTYVVGWDCLAVGASVTPLT
jgi:hypothetical protein